MTHSNWKLISPAFGQNKHFCSQMFQGKQWDPYNVRLHLSCHREGKYPMSRLMCGGGSDCESRLDCTHVNDSTSKAVNVIPADGVPARFRLDFSLLLSALARLCAQNDAGRISEETRSSEWRALVFYISSWRGVSCSCVVCYCVRCALLLSCTADIRAEGNVTLKEKCFWGFCSWTCVGLRSP